MKKLLFSLFFLTPFIAFPQFVPNYDESNVPEYELPPLLKSEKGKTITSPEEWKNIRRPELVELFSSQVYGKIPKADVLTGFKVVEEKSGVLDGMADRKQVRITFTGNGQSLSALLLIYLPAGGTDASPVFTGYNFYGNHTIFPDPGIIISESWVRDNPNFMIFNNRADELSTGCRTGRWPVINILRRGYGLAVMYYGDIDPDFDDGFQNGIHPMFYKPRQEQPEPDQWGSIGAWAFGLSKAVDYFEQDPDIDHTNVAVIGHSRLGKTSLWAGAMDERFAMIISNDSGCGGAALSRREFGETVGRINTAFPHWFSDNFNRYNDNEKDLPVDQHQLIALMAPRPVYIASAAADEWADAKGEFLSGYHASRVYRLFGLKGIDTEKMPAVNQPVKHGHIGYHIRSGEHDLTYYDWEQYLDFADLHF